MTAPVRPATATPIRPAPAAGTVAPVPAWRRPLRRVGDLRRTTPGRLRLILIGLVALGVLAGLLTGVTAASARSGTGQLRDNAQPLLLEAETVFSALADADTTAAQAFLAGGLEPAGLTKRYDEDLDRAAAALTSAARRTPADSAAGRAISALNAGLPRYAALVATARADNRQGLPVGAAFLAAASQLNREELQAEAQTLLRLAQEEVGDGYDAAPATGWATTLTLLLLALVGALVAAQVHVARFSRRTFNVPLVAATAVTLLLAGLVAVVLNGQREHLVAAADDGSRPIALLAEARLLALRERGDEALTLAARSGGTGRHEEDFDRAAERMRVVLTGAGVAVRGTDARARVDAATAGHRAYLDAHQQVNDLDRRGSYDEAVQLAIGAETTTTFGDMTGSLDAALTDRRQAFEAEIGAAGRGLGLLTVLGPLLALAACALAAAGLRARLREYQ